MKLKTLLAIVAVAVGVSVPAMAGYDYVTLTNSLTATGVISNATTIAASQSYDLHPGSALVVSPKLVGAGTTNVVFGLNLYNGQDWTTTNPLLFTNACNQGTNVVGANVIPASSLAGYSKVRWDYTSTTGFTNITLYGVQVQQLY